MIYRFPLVPSVPAIVGAVMLSLAACPSLAQASDTAPPAACAGMPDRAAGLRFVPTSQSLSDLALVIAENQGNLLNLAHVSVLEGPCADDVYAVRMSQITFHDGAVFSANATGQFTYSPSQSGLSKLWGNAVPTTHPDVKRAEFIMAAEVDGAYGDRSVDVGLWKTSDDYFVAAYTRQLGGFSDPVVLVRSTQPIKSVTFFPSPDSNGGGLALLESTGSGIVLVNLSWDHSAFSKLIR